MMDAQQKVVLYNKFVRLANLLQCLLDFLLEPLLGFSTRSGLKKEREKAEVFYEKSAQIVSHH
jgi:hypothetical protein